MSAVIRFIPNLFTLGNLFCGFMALIFTAKEQMVTAVLFIGIALVLDFLDGFVARLLKAQSELGIQLDSLADAVTFGVVPGYMMFQMIVITQGYYFTEITDWPFSVFAMASVAALLPLGAVYRLALFNVKENRSGHFEGLPVPAMSMVVIGIPLVLELNYHLNFYNPLTEGFIELLANERRWDRTDVSLVKLLYHVTTYQVLSVVLCGLMISRIPMLSIKFHGFAWKKNRWTYAVLIWGLVCYFIFVIPYIDLGPLTYGLVDYLILPIFMGGYFILSFIYATFGASKEKPASDEVQS